MHHIVGVCDVWFTCVFLESLHLHVYDSPYKCTRREDGWFIVL